MGRRCGTKSAQYGGAGGSVQLPPLTPPPPSSETTKRQLTDSLSHQPERLGSPDNLPIRSQEGVRLLLKKKMIFSMPACCHVEMRPPKNLIVLPLFFLKGVCVWLVGGEQVKELLVEI